MCWSATLAMEMSRTSMKAASPTVGATTQGFAFGAPAVSAGAAMAPSADLDAGHDRHAGPERMIRVVGRVEDDLHGNALHDLDVVAGGIFRWQQREGGAA